jgi:hypothetical protein
MMTYWRCGKCTVCGAYESRDITTKTDRALPDAKHVASCGGTLLTGINAEALARMLGTAPVEAAS